MDFRHAYFAMLSGKAVRLPEWGGYWVWERSKKYGDCCIQMHCRDGRVIDIRDSEEPGYTFSNVAETRWEVCEPELRQLEPKPVHILP